MSTVPHTKLPVRCPAKERYDAFAERRRLKLVDVVEIALDALTQLPKDELDALIERKPPRPRRREPAKV